MRLHAPLYISAVIPSLCLSRLSSLVSSSLSISLCFLLFCCSVVFLSYCPSVFPKILNTPRRQHSHCHFRSYGSVYHKENVSPIPLGLCAAGTPASGM